jgi:hypothetical protein
MGLARARLPEPDMLKVVPKAWSYAFSVTDGTESFAQAVDLSWWRDKGELRIQGAIYRTHREGSSYVLESAAGVVARADRPRAWFREFVIEHSGHRYTLRAKSAFRRKFLLLDGETQVGSISAEGLFTRKAAVELPRELPLFLQVFIIWLAMTLWKHDDSSGG